MEFKCDTCVNSYDPDVQYCDTCSDGLNHIEKEENMEYPIYYSAVGSCDYDEHELDLYFIGDKEGENYGIEI